MHRALLHATCPLVKLCGISHHVLFSVAPHCIGVHVGVGVMHVYRRRVYRCRAHRRRVHRVNSCISVSYKYRVHRYHAYQCRISIVYIGIVHPGVVCIGLALPSHISASYMQTTTGATNPPSLDQNPLELQSRDAWNSFYSPPSSRETLGQPPTMPPLPNQRKPPALHIRHSDALHGDSADPKEKEGHDGWGRPGKMEVGGRG